MDLGVPAVPGIYHLPNKIVYFTRTIHQTRPDAMLARLMRDREGEVVEGSVRRRRRRRRESDVCYKDAHKYQM